MKVQPNKKYKIPDPPNHYDITDFNDMIVAKSEPERQMLVNREELFRLRNLVESHITKASKSFKRLDNLIKQGTSGKEQEAVAKATANETPAGSTGSPQGEGKPAASEKDAVQDMHLVTDE